MRFSSLRANLHNPSTSRERLLDAAEELFADYGFNGVSVCKIVEAAKVNLGAIPYHFGTKENLFKQVIYRRALPLQKEREARIRDLTEGGKKPTMEDVLWALIGSTLRRSQGEPVIPALDGACLDGSDAAS